MTSAVLIDLEEGRERQTVDIGIQRTDTVRQGNGQHGHDVAGIVDRRTATVGLVVERGTRGDVMGHIGDVHAEQHVTVFHRL